MFDTKTAVQKILGGKKALLLTDKMSKNKKKWVCKDCGQVCMADKNPTEGFPKWADGHRCKFREGSDEEW